MDRKLYCKFSIGCAIASSITIGFSKKSIPFNSMQWFEICSVNMTLTVCLDILKSTLLVWPRMRWIVWPRMRWIVWPRMRWIVWPRMRSIEAQKVLVWPRVRWIESQKVSNILFSFKIIWHPGFYYALLFGIDDIWLARVPNSFALVVTSSRVDRNCLLLRGL